MSPETGSALSFALSQGHKVDLVEEKCQPACTLHPCTGAHVSSALVTDTPTQSRWLKLRHKEFHLTLPVPVLVDCVGTAFKMLTHLRLLSCVWLAVMTFWELS